MAAANPRVGSAASPEGIPEVYSIAPRNSLPRCRRCSSPPSGSRRRCRKASMAAAGSARARPSGSFSPTSREIRPSVSIGANRPNPSGSTFARRNGKRRRASGYGGMPRRRCSIGRRTGGRRKPSGRIFSCWRWRRCWRAAASASRCSATTRRRRRGGRLCGGLPRAWSRDAAARTACRRSSRCHGMRV